MGADDHPDTERPQRYLSHQHLSLQWSSTRNEGEANVCVCVRVCVRVTVCVLVKMLLSILNSMC